jgi:hypothetical protein
MEQMKTKKTPDTRSEEFDPFIRSTATRVLHCFHWRALFTGFPIPAPAIEGYSIEDYKAIKGY